MYLIVDLHHGQPEQEFPPGRLLDDVKHVPDGTRDDTGITAIPLLAKRVLS